MSGEVAPVLHRTWKEVWQPLSRGKEAPPDLFSELLRELEEEPAAPVPPVPPPPEAFNNDGELVDPQHVAARAGYDRALKKHLVERSAFEVAIAGGDARPLFKKLLQRASKSEVGAITLLEGAYDVLDGLSEELAANYRKLTLAFVANHNLGYSVDVHFRLHPSMPAVFSRLMREVKQKAAGHPHTAQMFGDFEEALFDLRLGRTEARLKTCLIRQFNLLEALGRQCPNVDALTLGDICNQLQWPHPTIRGVGRNLNGFRSDFPGIAHAGNANAHPLSMKDFVSISMMLASISPYFVADLDGELCYGG